MGWLARAERYPRVIDPASGRVWSSNNRPVGRPLLDRLGLEAYIMGPRARQVRDGLMARDRITPRGSLDIQLDDRALFLERWREFLLRHLDAAAVATETKRREFRDLLREGWDGRASTSSAGYLLVARFRYKLARRAIGPFLGDADSGAFEPSAFIEWWESALWRLAHEQPPHLLAARWNGWRDLILASVDAAITAATADGRPLAEAVWGSTTGRMSHPLATAVPWLSRWLDMPFVAVPGDVNMPRVRFRDGAMEVSATLRMVVSPGHEEDGIFHMPGGQSGHPLSPHYADMYRGWVEGRPTPFLPGAPVETLTLLPAGR